MGYLPLQARGYGVVLQNRRGGGGGGGGGGGDAAAAAAATATSAVGRGMRGLRFLHTSAAELASSSLTSLLLSPPVVVHRPRLWSPRQFLTIFGIPDVSTIRSISRQTPVATSHGCRHAPQCRGFSSPGAPSHVSHETMCHPSSYNSKATPAQMRELAHMPCSTLER